jgi:hypothetical protein
MPPILQHHIQIPRLTGIDCKISWWDITVLRLMQDNNLTIACLDKPNLGTSLKCNCISTINLIGNIDLYVGRTRIIGGKPVDINKTVGILKFRVYRVGAGCNQKKRSPNYKKKEPDGSIKSVHADFIG